MASITTDDVMIEQVRHSGAFACSAIVTDDATGFDWVETTTFYDYGRAEAVAMFVARCAEQGYRKGSDY